MFSKGIGSRRKPHRFAKCFVEELLICLNEMSLTAIYENVDVNLRVANNRDDEYEIQSSGLLSHRLVEHSRFIRVYVVCRALHTFVSSLGIWCHICARSLSAYDRDLRALSSLMP